MAGIAHTAFDLSAFLAKAGPGRTVVRLKPTECVFGQGDTASHIFYLQTGQAKLSVVSTAGKEATMSLLSPGDFTGEESLKTALGLYMASVTATTTCTALKVDRSAMLQALHKEHSLSDLFLSFLLTRSMRIQADLVDQRFNPCIKRLARVLLLMADPVQPGEENIVIPKVSQETLAGLVGTTRSRVSFFMNRFRDLGLIEYNGRILVHKPLLSVVLREDVGPVRIEKPSVVSALPSRKTA